MPHLYSGGSGGEAHSFQNFLSLFQFDNSPAPIILEQAQQVKQTCWAFENGSGGDAQSAHNASLFEADKAAAPSTSKQGQQTCK